MVTPKKWCNLTAISIKKEKEHEEREKIGFREEQRWRDCSGRREEDVKKKKTEITSRSNFKVNEEMAILYS